LWQIAVELLLAALFAVDETIDGLVADDRLTLFELEPASCRVVLYFANTSALFFNLLGQTPIAPNLRNCS
jgi:hypothetical protein